MGGARRAITISPGMRATPAAGHKGMTIGIEWFRDPAELRLDRMLLQPFRNDHAAATPPPSVPPATPRSS